MKYKIGAITVEIDDTVIEKLEQKGISVLKEIESTVFTLVDEAKEFVEDLVKKADEVFDTKDESDDEL